MARSIIFLESINQSGCTAQLALTVLLQLIPLGTDGECWCVRNGGDGVFFFSFLMKGTGWVVVSHVESSETGPRRGGATARDPCILRAPIPVPSIAHPYPSGLAIGLIGGTGMDHDETGRPVRSCVPSQKPPKTRTLADVWRVLIDAACHKLQATLKCVSRRSERNHLTYRDNMIILLYTRGWA